MTEEDLLNEMSVKSCEYNRELQCNIQNKKEQDEIILKTFDKAWKRWAQSLKKD